MKKQLKQKEIELLSAYLDNQLSGKEKLRVESKIQEDETWKFAFNNLKITRKVLHYAPKIKVPRNFTLRPEMVNSKRRSFTSYPTMRLVSSIASILFALVFVGDFMYKGALPVSDVANQVSFSSADLAEESAGEPMVASMDDADGMEAPQEEMAPAAEAEISADEALGNDQDQADSLESNDVAEPSSDTPNLQENSETPAARRAGTAITTDAPETDIQVEDEDTEDENQSDTDLQNKSGLEEEIEPKNLGNENRINNIITLTKWALGILAIITGIQTFRTRRN